MEKSQSGTTAVQPLQELQPVEIILIESTGQVKDTLSPMGLSVSQIYDIVFNHQYEKDPCGVILIL